MAPIRDTAELATHPPIPALWATSAFAAMVFVVLVLQVIHHFTKLRMACLIACFTTLALTITNTLDTYYPLKLDLIHSLLFTFLTIFYFDLIIAIFLDIGGAFYYLKDRRTPLFWIVIVLVVSFSLVAGITALTLFLTNVSEVLILVLSIFVVVACLAGMIGAVSYAFIPLIVNRKIPATQSEAFAVGIWYLSTVMTIMICYIVFYALAFVNEANYNPLGQINQGIDFCFRSVLVLAYGLPPNHRMIKIIRTYMVVFSSRAGTSPTASKQARLSSVVAADSQKVEDASRVVVVVQAPPDVPRVSKDITD